MTLTKNCISMPFVDTNSHLTRKLRNLEVKYQGISENYNNFFYGTRFGIVRILYFCWQVLPTNKTTLVAGIDESSMGWYKSKCLRMSQNKLSDLMSHHNKYFRNFQNQLVNFYWILPDCDIVCLQENIIFLFTQG